MNKTMVNFITELQEANTKADVITVQNEYLDRIFELYWLDDNEPKADALVADYEDYLKMFIFSGATFIAGHNEIILVNSPRFEGALQATHFDAKGPKSHATLFNKKDAFDYLREISAMPVAVQLVSHLA